MEKDASLGRNRALSGKKLISKIGNFREGVLILVIVILFLVMSNISEAFFSYGNFTSTFMGLATDGIVVVGMTVALICGDFDLSVGSLTCLAGVITGKLYLGGLNIWLSALISVVLVMLLGLVNGLLITKVGLSSFIATLGMMGIARGLCLIITTGTPLSLYSMPDDFKYFGQGKIASIPVLILIFIVIAGVGDFLVRKSSAIRKVFYTGSNEKAAMYSGINTSKIKMGVFALTALASGLSGTLSVARLTVASPTYGQGLEMTAISAAVIGGVSLTGGEGSVLGAVLGLILLSFINSALVILNVSVYWQSLISNLILLLAVSFDMLTHKRHSLR